MALSIRLASTAFAQDAPKAISPLKVESDINGVNLTTGLTQLAIPVLSVAGDPRLKFDWVQNSAPYVKITTYSGEVPDSYVAIQTSGVESEQFHCRDDSCDSNVVGTGSTYNPSQRRFLQVGTGAAYTFNNQSFNQLIGGKYYSLYYASAITFPDGEQLSFSYDSATVSGYYRRYYRPTRITSNTGYYIVISYASATFDPNAVDAMTPVAAKLYGPGDPNTPFAQLSYTQTSTYDVIITDQSGRSFTCTGCANRVDGPLYAASGAVTLPGEGGPAMQFSGQSVPGASYVSVVSSAVKDGVRWSYSYTNLRPNCPSSGQVSDIGAYDRLTVTGPNGYNVAYDLNPAGCGPISPPASIRQITDSLGRATQYTFDSRSRPTAMTLPEGNGISVTYDMYANITSKVSTAKSGSGLPNITESAYVDVNNCTGVLCYRPVWMRDGLNRQTDLAYNAAGQLTEETDPADATGDRRKTYVSYDASNGLSRKSVVRVCGTSTTCGTTGEFRTEYSYWNNTFLPSQERRVDPATNQVLTTSYTYDAAGRLLAKDGPLAGSADAEYFRYDVLGRKIREVSAANASGVRVVKRYTYRDSDDKVTVIETGTLTDPDAASFTVTDRVDTSYDGHRNPIRSTLSSGNTPYSITDRSFDDRGRALCETVRMNLASPPAQGSDACTLGSPGSQGQDRITRSQYDAANQLLVVTRGLNTPEQADKATYTYSANGKPVSLEDGKGNLMAMGYDGFDRQSSWTFPSPSAVGQVNANDYEAYGYDAAGNRTSLRKRDGVTLTYQYDGLNLMVVKSVPGSASGAAGYGVYYGYDMRGLQTYARFGSPSGAGVTNGYDAFGRLTSSTTTMDGASRTLSSQYDAGGNRTLLSGDAGYSASFSYDPAGRMTAYNGLAAIGYDGLGRRTAVTMGPGGTTSATGYGYDAIGRLNALSHDLAGSSADQNQGFAYNPASQIASETRDNDAYAWTGHYNANRPYATNGLNQYTSAGPAAFGYDANGNLISDGSTSFVYDAENRLVQATGARSASLAYDPLGRLWQVQAASGTTRFVYDGDRLTLEYDGSGNVRRSYVHGPDPDAPLVWYEANGPRRFLHADHQGSIVALADDAGNASAINAYDEYGIPQGTNLGRFQYTGQAWLPELGMYYYKARIYSPTLGRFLQTDPIGYKDQVNLYAYVGDDPVNAADPSGLAGCGSNTALDSASCSGPTLVGIAAAAANKAQSAASKAASWAINGPQNVSLGEDMLERIQQLRDNVANGSAGEATAAEILVEAKYRILAQQVYIKTDLGLRITDFVTRNQYGQLVGYEVKTGFTARRSPLQVQKDISIANKGGTVISRGLAGVGLPYGSRIQFSTGIITILDLVKF